MRLTSLLPLALTFSVSWAAPAAETGSSIDWNQCWTQTGGGLQCAFNGKHSLLGLNLCFSNAGGELGAWRNGGFMGSCSIDTGAETSLQGYTLKAICKSGGQDHHTEIDMRPYVTINEDNRLSCFGQTGGASY